MAVLAFGLTGCKTVKPLYFYGEYQESVYQHFKADDTSVAQQIESLEKSIEQAAANDLAPAPGLYAHLGFLYLKAGNSDAGFASMNKEKELYPEATQYIDFLISNAAGEQNEGS